jgi:hypothetical protein
LVEAVEIGEQVAVRPVMARGGEEAAHQPIAVERVQRKLVDVDIEASDDLDDRRQNRGDPQNQGGMEVSRMGSVSRPQSRRCERHAQQHAVEHG